MRGYPKCVATKQDYANLLAMPEHKARASEELKNIVSLNDSMVRKATTPIDPNDHSKGYNTKEIENPMPSWKQKGFASRQEVADIVIANGGTL